MNAISFKFLKWIIAFRLIILHQGGKIFKLGMLSSFSSLKYILGYILFECGNQLNLAMPCLFTAKSVTTWGELVVLLRATVGRTPHPPSPLPSTVDGSPSPLFLPASLHAYLSSPDLYSATVAIHFSFSWRDMPNFCFLAKYILKQKTTKIGCAKSPKSF